MNSFILVLVESAAIYEIMFGILQHARDAL